MSIFSYRVLPLCVLALASCGGGSVADNPSVAPGTVSYVATLEFAQFPGTTPVPASGPIVLYDQQFLDFSHNSAILVASVSPSPAQTPSVTWTSTNSNVTVQPQAPNYASPAPTAPPQGTFVAIGSTYGAATVRAGLGTPVNQAATIQVNHYHSLSFGCHFRYYASFSFDGTSASGTTGDDLYATIGSDKLDPLNPCTNTPFVTAAGTPEVWHTPYGGTLIANTTLQQFASVQANQWANSATEFTPQNGVLLFKTKNGLIVKAQVPIGPYEVSGTDGQFPY